jgi:hypothetical protein
MSLSINGIPFEIPLTFSQYAFREHFEKSIPQPPSSPEPPQECHEYVEYALQVSKKMLVRGGFYMIIILIFFMAGCYMYVIMDLRKGRVRRLAEERERERERERELERLCGVKVDKNMGKGEGEGKDDELLVNVLHNLRD